MIELTLERTKQLLTEAVAEKGEGFVYVNRAGRQATEYGSITCHYVHGDEPGCIVGHILHKAGVSLADLSDYESQGAEDPVENLTDPEPGVTKLLNWAQDFQDRGVPWGKSVQRALARLESAGH